MNAEEYIEERLQDQIDWYDSKSKHNQQLHKSLRKVEIVAAAIIPFASGIAISLPNIEFVFFIITGLLGITVTIITSIISLGKYQENWIEYRTICESLKKEKYLFNTGVKPYNGDTAYQILVQRVESLISKENTNWAQYMYKSEEEANSKEKDR